MTTAVIPCGGRGTRLAARYPDTPKELLPVAGKPLLEWTLEEAAAAGLERVVVVTSPLKPLIAQYLSDRQTVRPSVAVVVQPEPRGLGDAITCARDHVGGDDVAVLLPDNLFPKSVNAIAPVLAARRATGLAAVLLAQRPASAGATGRASVRRRPDGLLQVEAVASKGVATGKTAPIGRMVFGSDVFERLERLRAGLAPGAELDDVPLLQTLAAAGRLVGVELDGPFYDAGVPEGYTAALNALS